MLRERKERGEANAVRGFGTCMFMCPDGEKLRREAEGRISVFEVGSSSGDGRMGQYSAPAQAVKEYVRAGAGHRVPEPNDLRPPAVLIATMKYLMSSVADREDHPWHVVYEFLSNRVQAVKLDITFQQPEPCEVSFVYEVAARFYLYAQHRLWGSSPDKFDPKLNRDQLQQCLVKLIRLPFGARPSSHKTHVAHIGHEEAKPVGRGRARSIARVVKPVGRGTVPKEAGQVRGRHEQGVGRVGRGLGRGREKLVGQEVRLEDKRLARTGGQGEVSASGNEDSSTVAEFASYYLLVNLGVPSAIDTVMELPTALRRHPLVQRALDVGFAFLQNNFVRVFRLTDQLSALERCALLPHITQIRRQAIQTMTSAYSSRNSQFPLRLLSKWLLFQDQDKTAGFCHYHGVEVTGENVHFQKGAFRIPNEGAVPAEQSLAIPELLSSGGAGYASSEAHQGQQRGCSIPMQPPSTYLLSGTRYM